MIPDISTDLESPLREWLALLERWNRTHALTSLAPEARWEELVLDAMALLPHLAGLPSGSRVLDLGTGMGSPSVPLALARPDLHMIGLDASAKKLAFLRQSALELGIKNLEAVHGRFESTPTVEVDMGVAKALAQLDQLAVWWSRLAMPSAPLLALKGPGWESEPRPEGWKLEAAAYDLPTRGRRYVIRMTR